VVQAGRVESQRCIETVLVAVVLVGVLHKALIMWRRQNNETHQQAIRGITRNKRQNIRPCPALQQAGWLRSAVGRAIEKAGGIDRGWGFKEVAGWMIWNALLFAIVDVLNITGKCAGIAENVIAARVIVLIMKIGQANPIDGMTSMVQFQQ
jgi:hypothetical protein